MSYQNIRGTTSPSFKIGVNGVSIASEAILDSGKKKLVAKFKNSVTGQTETHSLVYDTDIPASNLEGIEYTEKTITLKLVGGVSLTISRTVSGVNFEGNGATPEGIVLFSGGTGDLIKDSGRTIEDSINIEDPLIADNSNVPSIGAVVNFVGHISDDINKRMDGDITNLKGYE